MQDWNPIGVIKRRRLDPVGGDGNPSLQSRALYGACRPVEEIEVPYEIAKRILDVFGAACALLIGFPVFFIVGMLVKLTSKGPIFFHQTRVGKVGRLFECYKFRSMYVDAEARQAELMHLNEADGPVFKIKDDPRITPIGRFIRAYSLDELPQFLNVIMGDMSLVGPRPPIPSEVREYKPRYLGRLAVKPGLTCLWQVSGRSNVAFEEWMEMDLTYIDTMSFWGDVKILARTVPAVLFARGAY